MIVDGNNYASETMKPFLACIDVVAPPDPPGPPFQCCSECQTVATGGAFERHKFRNRHERFSLNIELGVRGRSAEEPIPDMECAFVGFAVHCFWLRNYFRLL